MCEERSAVDSITSRKHWTAHGALTMCAILATALPFLIQLERIFGTRFSIFSIIMYVLAPLAAALHVLGAPKEFIWIALVIGPFFATPILIVLGIGNALLAGKSSGATLGRRTSVAVFLICAFVWTFTLISYRLLPLFAGESRIHRGFMDRWLDYLL